VTAIRAKVAVTTIAAVTAADTAADTTVAAATAVATTAVTRFKRSEIQTHHFSIKPKNDSQC